MVRDSGDSSKVRDTDAVFDQVDKILAVSGETSLDPVDTCLLLTMTLFFKRIFDVSVSLLTRPLKFKVSSADSGDNL